MDSTKKHTIMIELRSNHDEGLTRSVLVGESKSLLENLLNLEIAIDHSCGGNGTCGTCRFQVLEGYSNISPKQDIELEMSADRGFANHERLACQSYILGKVRIEVRTPEDI